MNDFITKLEEAKKETLMKLAIVRWLDDGNTPWTDRLVVWIKVDCRFCRVVVVNIPPEYRHCQFLCPVDSLCREWAKQSGRECFSDTGLQYFFDNLLAIDVTDCGRRMNDLMNQLNDKLEK